MGEKVLDVQSQGVSKGRRKGKRRSRELLLLSEGDSVKEKIVSCVLELGREKEYFTNEDVLGVLVGRFQLDMSDIKKIRSLYSYVAKVTVGMEKEGYLKGYRVPGSRKLRWKLVKPPFS